MTYILLKATAITFSFIPFPILYIFSDGLRPILQYVIRYRKKVIDKNISYLFPNKPSAEKRKIRTDYYKNFTDIFLEAIKGINHDPHKIVERYRIINPEILDPYFYSGQNIIAYSHHLTNWEWGTITLGLQTKQHMIGIAKKISNTYINRMFTEKRSANNLTIVYPGDTKAFFDNIEHNYAGRSLAMAFISDQFPYGKTRSFELDFFGKPTLFHAGTAHYACAKNYPVLSGDIRRIRRGFYEVELVLLHNTPAEIGPKAVTEIYKDHLESLVRENPSAWLLSHKRFKNVINY